MLKIIQREQEVALAAIRQPINFGGLSLFYNSKNSLRWLNTILPTGEVSREDLTRMLAECFALDRAPWFEYFEACAPDLAPMLEEQGLRRQHAVPVLVLEKDEFRPTPTSARMLQMGEESAYRKVVDEGFGASFEVSDEKDAEVRKQIESGQCVAVSLQDEKIVAVGSSVGTNRVREIAGIATRPENRKMGHATQVITALLNDHFEQGGEFAWITSLELDVQNLYKRIGFKEAGTLLVYGFDD